MIDFGFDKIALISAVALIVIGPEKLPRVARTVGTLLGKAQRYVADVKAEVNRSIELDELKKMKTEFESAARDVESSVSSEINKTTTDLNAAWESSNTASSSYDSGRDAAFDELPPNSGQHVGWTPVPEYRRPKKNWRLSAARCRMVQQEGRIRGKAQSGAGRPLSAAAARLTWPARIRKTNSREPSSRSSRT